MKVRKTMIAVAVAALIPLGAAAIAGDNEYGSKDKAGAGASFKKLDANKDGKISQAEAAVDTTVVFSSADANGDGYIDSTEWNAAMSKDQDQQQPEVHACRAGATGYGAAGSAVAVEHTHTRH